MWNETTYGSEPNQVEDRLLSGLGNCGCKSNQAPPAPAPAPATGFDLSDIPLWVWLAAGGVAAFLVLKDNKSGGRK